MNQQLTRRRVLGASMALGVAGLRARSLTAADKIAASERLHVGVIGVAGQGGYDLNEVAAAGAAIVALCDVDENRAASARQRFPRARYYTDFRRLLEQKGLDAVVVATPDHTHAF